VSALTNAAETAILQLIFENANWANIGDATGLRGSSTAGSFYVSLHTADPGETGNQTTSEISYTGYARVAVARSTSGWTVTNDSVVPDAAITFGAMTAGAGGTVTHFGIGTDSSGTGNLILRGAVTPNISVSNGVTPQLGATSSVTAA
jgi:hypothetical protein